MQRITIADFINSYKVTEKYFVNVSINNDKLATKVSLATLKTDYVTLEQYFKFLEDNYAIDQVNVIVYKKNGSSFAELASYRVVFNDSVALSGIDEDNDEQEQVKAKPAGVKNTQVNMSTMSPEIAAAVLPMQMQFLNSELDRSKKENEEYRRKLNAQDDELRKLRSDLAVSDSKKELEILASKSQQAQSLSGIMKDALTPETIGQITELYKVVKGVPATPVAGSLDQGLDTLRKDANSTFVSLIRSLPDDDVKAMMYMFAMSDAKAGWFSTLGANLKTEIEKANAIKQA